MKTGLCIKLYDTLYVPEVTRNLVSGPTKKDSAHSGRGIWSRLLTFLQLIMRAENGELNISTDLFIRLAGGGLAGITAASVTYPLDLIRTRLSAQGVGPNLAISFSAYDTTRSYWQLHRFSVNSGARMQLEGAGGRARVYKTGILGTFRQIIKAEGFRGIYRGILPEYYKVVPSIGILFMTCEKLKQVFSKLDACR
ncbi:putative mitochondrial carrier domain superfamily [Helianthus anomalus]